MTSREIPLNNGTGCIPAVGFGTWTVHGETGTDSELETAVCVAIDAGYRHIDTAWMYKTQRGIGRALEKKIKEGVVKREDMFITTKLWNTHHNPKLVMEELKDSLEQLGTHYVDMFLVHWPIAFKDEDLSGDVVFEIVDDRCPTWTCYPLEDVWKEMEASVKAGLTKNIGLSNFNKRQTDRILDSCSIKPSNMQIEISPYLVNKQLRDYCKDNGISVTAYSPFGAPHLSCRAPGPPNVFEDPVLLKIAKLKKKSIAQVVLRFHLQSGVVVIPKSVTPTRIHENIDVFDFELTEDEMKQIESLDSKTRSCSNPSINATGHKEYPFHDLY